MFNRKRTHYQPLTHSNLSLFYLFAQTKQNNLHHISTMRVSLQFPKIIFMLVVVVLLLATASVPAVYSLPQALTPLPMVNTATSRVKGFNELYAVMRNSFRDMDSWFATLSPECQMVDAKTGLGLPCVTALEGFKPLVEGVLFATTLHVLEECMETRRVWATWVDTIVTSTGCTADWSGSGTITFDENGLVTEIRSVEHLQSAFACLAKIGHDDVLTNLDTPAAPLPDPANIGQSKVYGLDNWYRATRNMGRDADAVLATYAPKCTIFDANTNRAMSCAEFIAPFVPVLKHQTFFFGSYFHILEEDQEARVVSLKWNDVLVLKNGCTSDWTGAGTVRFNEAGLITDMYLEQDFTNVFSCLSTLSAAGSTKQEL
jgi:hypothetical protein